MRIRNGQSLEGISQFRLIKTWGGKRELCTKQRMELLGSQERHKSSVVLVWRWGEDVEKPRGRDMDEMCVIDRVQIVDGSVKCARSDRLLC